MLLHCNNQKYHIVMLFRTLVSYDKNIYANHMEEQSKCFTLRTISVIQNPTKVYYSVTICYFRVLCFLLCSCSITGKASYGWKFFYRMFCMKIKKERLLQ